MSRKVTWFASVLAGVCMLIGASVASQAAPSYTCASGAVTPDGKNAIGFYATAQGSGFAVSGGISVWTSGPTIAPVRFYGPVSFVSYTDANNVTLTSNVLYNGATAQATMKLSNTGGISRMSFTLTKAGVQIYASPLLTLYNGRVLIR